MDTVTTDELKKFQKRGFIIRKNVLNEDIILSINEELEKIIDYNNSNANIYFEPSITAPHQQIIRRIEKISSASPLIKHIFYSDAILGSVEDLLGEPAYLFKDKLNMKLPGGSGFKPHVDGHFWWNDANNTPRKGWSDYGSMFINALISLDYATIENGCIYIASLEDTFRELGTTFDQIISKVSGRGPDIQERFLANITMYPQETEPGDVIFFDWRCVHGSTENYAQNSRRILYSTFNRQSDGDHYETYFREKQTSLEPQARKSLGGRK